MTSLVFLRCYIFSDVFFNRATWLSQTGCLFLNMTIFCGRQKTTHIHSTITKLVLVDTGRVVTEDKAQSVRQSPVMQRHDGNGKPL